MHDHLVLQELRAKLIDFTPCHRSSAYALVDPAMRRLFFLCSMLLVRAAVTVIIFRVEWTSGMVEDSSRSFV